MRIIIKAKPGSTEEKVEKIDENNYIVSVKAPPVRGMANAAIIKLLASYFSTSSSLIKIVSGYASRVKIVEISNQRQK